MGTYYHYILAAAAPVSDLRPEGWPGVHLWEGGLHDEESLRQADQWGDLDLFRGSEHGHGRGDKVWAGRILWRSDFSNPSAPQMSPGFTLEHLDHALVETKAALARFGDAPVRIVVLEQAF